MMKNNAVAILFLLVAKTMLLIGTSAPLVDAAIATPPQQLRGGNENAVEEQKPGMFRRLMDRVLQASSNGAEVISIVITPAGAPRPPPASAPLTSTNSGRGGSDSDSDSTDVGGSGGAGGTSYASINTSGNVARCPPGSFAKYNPEDQEFWCAGPDGDSND